jgi:hypothetical protein
LLGKESAMCVSVHARDRILSVATWQLARRRKRIKANQNFTQGRKLAKDFWSSWRLGAFA